MDIVGAFIGTIFGFILRPLYALISYSYDMIIALASVNFFGGASGSAWFSGLITRIYVLLGVFMLFRLGFSMLQYIVNPDKMADQKMGIGNIVKRTIIALVVLVLFQPAVNYAMKLQQVVLEDDVLGKIILGSSTEISSEDRENFGDTLALTVVTTLTTLQDEWASANSCSNYVGWSIAQIYDSADTACISAINNSLTSSGSNYNLDNLMKDDQSYLLWFSSTVLFAGYEFFDVEEDKIMFNTNWLLLTIVGVIFIWLLLSIALQIAIRVIKLAFLVLIAPIPIISYIEPNTSKNIFSMWAKELGTTYAMLFIRLATLYFAVLIVLLVNSVIGSELTNYSGGAISNNILVNVQLKLILFIAAFLFADQLPKMIENIFGIKSEGGMFKSPIRQMRESKSLMGTAGRVAGTGLAAASLLRPGGKLSAFKKDLTSGAAALKGKPFKDKASFALTQAGKAATLAGSISRGGSDMSKYVQEHKDEGFLETIKDSQRKNETRIDEKLGRQARDEWDYLMGSDFQIQNRKAGLEKERQDVQLQKEQLEEQKRLRMESVSADRQPKQDWDRSGDFSSSEANKKNDLLKDHKRTVEVASAKSKDAEAKLQQLRAEHHSILQERNSRQTQLANDIAQLNGRKTALNSEVSSLETQLKGALTTEQRHNLETQLNAKRAELSSVEGTITSHMNENQQLAVRVAAAADAVKTQEKIVADANVEWKHLDNSTSTIEDAIYQATLAIDKLRGSQSAADFMKDPKNAVKIKEINDYLNNHKDFSTIGIELDCRDLTAGTDMDKFRTYSNGFELQIDTFFDERKEAIIEYLRTDSGEAKQLREQLERAKEQAQQITDENARNRAIAMAEETYNKALENYVTSSSENVESFKDTLRTSGGYYDMDKVKGFVKSRERKSIDEEARIAREFDSSLRSKETKIKELSNEISDMERQIRDIKEKTKGIGIADSTWDPSEMSSFSDGPGPGASQ